ncbi:hypothetical protein [Bacillus horti]|uniref:Phage protein n=1 Tax=Caldalkalibacillus horti TaxID=77523 RepID=A0ABT9W6L8_9BACI|nr:hypothetical protein [Bacillus horti]MDQ0168495.1 hypothetical protein [Bacillus horti]
MKYTFEELVKDLEMGHEVEFWFEDNKYSISHNENGWFFKKFGDEFFQTYTDPSSLLAKVKVDSKSLKEIWNEVKIESVF